MAAWDNVQLPSAPAAPSYAAPLLNFAPIGDLYGDYFKGTQMARTRAQQGAFKEGLPTLKDANGQEILDQNKQPQIDVRAAMNTMARLGGTEGASPFITLEMQRQLGKSAEEEAKRYAPGAQGAAEPGSTATTRPAVKPSGFPSVAAPPGVQTPGEATQPDTLANIVQSQIDDPVLAGKVMTVTAKQLGIDPGARIDPNNPQLVKNIRSAKGGVTPTGVTGDQPQTQPPSVAQRSDAVNQPAPSTANQPPIPPNQPGFWSLENAQRYESAANALAASGQSRAYFPNSAQSTQITDTTIKGLRDTAKQIRDVVKPTEAEKDLSRGTTQGKEVLQKDIARGEAAFTGIKSAADQWRRDIKPLNELAQGILNDPKMYSGIGAELRLDWNKVKAAFGGDPRAAMLQEALTKVTAATTLGIINQTRDQMSEGGSNAGRIFSQQVDLVTKASPQLTTSLAGNRFLMNVQARMGDLTAKVHDMASAYKSDPRHPYLDIGFDRMLSNYLEKNPVFTTQEQAHPELLGAPTMPAFPATPQGIAQQNKWAISMGIKQGEPVKTQTGNYRVYVYVPVRAPGGAPGAASAQPAPQQ